MGPFNGTSSDHLQDFLARSERLQLLRPEFNMILISMRSTVGPMKKTHIFSSIDVLVLLDTIMQSKPSVFFNAFGRGCAWSRVALF
jgi:hypothetical protein